MLFLQTEGGPFRENPFDSQISLQNPTLDPGKTPSRVKSVKGLEISPNHRDHRIGSCGQADHLFEQPWAKERHVATHNETHVVAPMNEGCIQPSQRTRSLHQIRNDRDAESFEPLRPIRHHENFRADNP